MALISIVIPAYNEANRIGRTIQTIRKFVAARPESFELVVSDDGSVDGTHEVVKRESGEMDLRIVRTLQNRGKGHAVRKGVSEAKGDIILFSDADLSTPIEELDKMLLALANGADVVFGSRALPSSDVQIHQNIFRETMGKTFNLLARLLVFRGIHDSQCGFKCFRREAAQRLFSLSKIDGFCFDAEIAYLAQREGYRIQEIPVVWRNDPQSKVLILSSSWQMLWDLFRIRWLHRNDR